MNKKNILFGLLITILIVIITLLSILKLTIFNKKFIINKLENNNYYDLVYKDTKNTINLYIISSGLPNNVIENIFSFNDIKTNINNYIDYIYDNKEYENNKLLVKERLNECINKYLKDHNLMIENENDINNLINEIINIYDNETSFYKKFNNYIYLLKKINIIITISLIVSIIILTTLFIVIKSNISYILSSCFMSSGLVLLFIKFVIYDKIKYESILIITETFSTIINKVLIDISNYLIRFGIIYIILSIIMMYIEVKRSKKNGRD